MARHATLTRLGDHYEDAKEIAAVVGVALLVIVVIGAMSIGVFGMFIHGWSGRWPW